MKYTIERLSESRVAIEVEIEPEQVERALTRAAQRLSRQYRIPGFRPGRAPRHIVEARLGRAALYEEAASELVNQAYREIVQKGEFEPVHQAELETLRLEPFSFRLIVPVRPTVRLGDYRALRFPLEVPEISDADVERTLERLQAQQTVWKVPEPARPARMGDRLTVELIGRIGEREFERHPRMELTLGDPNLLPGFEALVGAEVGQTVEFQTTLPETIRDKELAGQTAIYTVTVQAIHEPEVPPLDDELARFFGQESLSALRAHIRHELEEQAQKRAREAVLDYMVREMVKGATVDMPQALVEEESRALYQERENQLRRLKVSMPQYLQWAGKKEEELLQELQEIAAEQVRSYLVLQEFVRAEGLEGERGSLQQVIEERLLAIARGEVEAAGVPEPSPSGPTLPEEPTPAGAVAGEVPTGVPENPSSKPVPESKDEVSTDG